MLFLLQHLCPSKQRETGAACSLIWSSSSYILDGGGRHVLVCPDCHLLKVISYFKSMLLLSFANSKTRQSSASFPILYPSVKSRSSPLAWWAHSVRTVMLTDQGLPYSLIRHIIIHLSRVPGDHTNVAIYLQIQTVISFFKFNNDN